jgi:hypothetical protein
LFKKFFQRAISSLKIAGGFEIYWGKGRGGESDGFSDWMCDLGSQGMGWRVVSAEDAIDGFFKFV